MKFKEFFSQFNIFGQCKKYNLPLWQCPNFLFLVMGLLIVSSSLLTYQIGNHYITDPQIVTLIVLLLTTVLMVLAFIITNSFERLAEASRMKSEFVSIVSHQLRAPLSNLRWVIDLLMSGRLGPIEEKQTEYFKLLKENSSRMRDLVSDLLVVSKIESATLPLNQEKFFLAEVVQNIIAQYNLFAKASNIEIKFDSGKALPQIFADQAQLRLVLENLLDNAIRYVREKGVIQISLAQKESKIYFEIKDSGVGIPKEDQKYIFRKFFRAKNVLRHQTQGSGLGLYIAKSIIEKSGGKIGFISQEGQGSTFWFTVPIAR